MRFQRGFEARFVQLRAGYHDLLALAIEHRGLFVGGFLGFVAVSFLLAPFLGRNFFPQVDGGQILLHVRAPVGMRIEETAARFAEVEKAIREVIPPRRGGGGRRQYRHLSVVDQHDLQQHRHDRRVGRRHPDLAQPGACADRRYVSLLRKQLPRRFPGMSFSFLPADIVSQILNFGAPRRSICRSAATTSPRITPTPTSSWRRFATSRESPMRASSSRPAADDRCEHRSHARAVHRGDRGRRDRQPGRQSGRFQPGCAHLLAEREERRHLSDRAADAAIPDRHAAGAAESADQRHRRADHGARRHRQHPARARQRRRFAVRHCPDGGDLRDHPGTRSRRGLERHPADHRRRTTRTSRRARSSHWSARPRP